MTKGIKGFQKGHAIFNGSEKSWFKKGESFWKGKKRDEKTRKKISENLNGIIPWNKGLTKEIDKRVKDNAEKTGKTLHRLYEEGKLKTNSEYMKRLYKEGIFINPMKGRHHKEETKRKMSESKKGEKAYNWMGGISFEPYSSNFNKLFKKQ